MQQRTTHRHAKIETRGGFALPELGVLLAVGVVIVCLLAMIAADTRRQAGLHHSLSNLRQIGSLTGQYAADHENLMWGFSWTAEEQPSEFPDLRDAVTDRGAASNQAVDIIRRRAGYTDVDRILGWLPHASYNHLPLYDYMDSTAPGDLFLSPGDRVRRTWADLGRDLLTADVPKPSGMTEDPHWLRFTLISSYRLGAVFWSAPDAGHHSIYPSTHRSLFLPPNAELGQRSTDDVAYPSDKAMMFAEFDYWFNADFPLYMGYPDARTPILAADGAARVRTTGDMNPGFRPQHPQFAGPSQYTYSPNEDWEPPRRDGTWGSEPVIGGHRWTRSGLRGRDFNGPEIPWED